MNREELTGIVRELLSNNYSPNLKLDYHRYGLVKGIVSPVSTEDHEIIEIYKEITGEDIPKKSIKLDYLSKRYYGFERRREYD